MQHFLELAHTEVTDVNHIPTLVLEIRLLKAEDKKNQKMAMSG